MGAHRYRYRNPRYRGTLKRMEKELKKKGSEKEDEEEQKWTKKEHIEKMNFLKWSGEQTRMGKRITKSSAVSKLMAKGVHQNQLSLNRITLVAYFSVLIYFKSRV